MLCRRLSSSASVLRDSLHGLLTTNLCCFVCLLCFALLCLSVCPVRLPCMHALVCPLGPPPYILFPNVPQWGVSPTGYFGRVCVCVCVCVLGLFVFVASCRFGLVPGLALVALLVFGRGSASLWWFPCYASFWRLVGNNI